MTSIVPSTPSRLVVVLGYSDRRGTDLHPICASRLAHAANVAGESDVVVLSGWARTPRVRPEAELMAEAWDGSCRELVVDPDARHTLDNASNAVDDLARTDGRSIVVVTSRWHAPRARAIFAIAFRGTGARVVTSSPDEPISVSRTAHEVPRWLLLPVQLLAARRLRRSDGP